MLHTNAQSGPRSGSDSTLYAWWGWSVLGSDRIFLVILAAGLILRLVLLSASASMPLQIVDEQHYAQLATSLVERGEFAFNPGELTSMRPPLYPAVIAGLWALTGVQDPQVVRAAQVVIGLLLVVATYILARRLFGRSAALPAAAIVAFYPSLLFAGLLLLTELTFALLVVVFVLLLVATFERPRGMVAFVAGVTLGCAALTRSVLWPFPVVLVPFLLLVLPGPARRRITIAACCVAGFLLVVGPWSIRNTRLQHVLTMVDTMGGMNLRMGNYEFTPEDRMWDAVSLTGEQSWSYVLQDRPEARTWTVGQKDKWAQREAIAYMVANPSTTIRRSVLKFADFWGLEREMVAALMAGLYHPPRLFAWLATASVLVAYPLVALLAVLGVCRVTATEPRAHWLILLIVLFVTAIHTIVFGHSRYHLPLVPFLAMYAGAALAQRSWRDLFVLMPRRSWVPVALATMLVVVWSREVLFRDADHIRTLLRALQ